MAKTTPRVFSGIQPSGTLHLGNYLGALKQWVPLQETHDCIFSIVDLHAITVPYEPKDLQQRILDVALDYLAAGLDPKKATLFVQSHVPEHAELAWSLNTITPLGELERMTQYKEKSYQHASTSAGILTYPVLMAADILLYGTQIVPVGEDQQQHVELTRIIARKFNSRFGQTFIEAKTQLTEAKRVMSLADPLKKMSKSLGPKHYIALTDDEKTIREKVAKAVTASGGQTTGEMDPGVKNLLVLLKEFGTSAQVKKYEAAYADGSIRYSDLKHDLADALVKGLAPFQERRAKLAKDPKKVWKILHDGAKKARPIAQQTMQDVKQVMGLA
ncbi:MAG: tryptophan--tRNA ligase [Candidatus Nomurabacteria bacterium]|nr:MAG: tryptophan--tRNA ligase [Candidatus Nomurabacteria bacterium]